MKERCWRGAPPRNRKVTVIAAPAPDDALEVLDAIFGAGPDGLALQQRQIGLRYATIDVAYEFTEGAVYLHGIFDGSGDGQMDGRAGPLAATNPGKAAKYPEAVVQSWGSACGST